MEELIAPWRTLAEHTLLSAKKEGADGAEVSIVGSDGFSLAVRNGVAERLETLSNRNLTVTVYCDHHRGSVSTTDFSPREITEAVTHAIEIARWTERDPHMGLADREQMAWQAPDLDLSHPWTLSIDQALSIAVEEETRACELDRRIRNVDQVGLSTQNQLEVYANSHGFIGVVPRTSHEFDLSLIAKDGDSMETASDYTVARASSDLESFAEVTQRAVHRTVSRLHPRMLPTGEVPVLFEPGVARDLIGAFVAASSGSRLYRKASFLVDRLGQSIFAPGITIAEKPHLERGIGSAPFDDNGVATRSKVFVDRGVLTSYALDHYSASKLGLSTTGNAGGVFNLQVQGTHESPAMLRMLGTGVLVTELIGHGINLTTGDYSQGASGFWVERGEIQYPVSQITIAGNLRDIFIHCVAAGTDIDRRATIQTGSLLIEKMVIAGE